MKTVCIYCGARPGNDPAILEHTLQLATEIVSRDINLLYGGSSSGLMGQLADQALSLGGHVIGVMPDKQIGLELVHPSLSEMHLVDSMSTRKNKMQELSDGFIALPGGFGTMDELFETLTSAQINLHTKPVGLLNVNGYYNHLLAFLDNACEMGLLAPYNRSLLKVASTPAALLDKMFSDE